MKKEMRKWMTVCLLALAAVSAHGQIYYDKPVSTETVIKDLHTLMDRFCGYVEKVGSSTSYHSPDIKHIIEKEVPSLFYDIASCHMITTYAVSGKKQRKTPMQEYFRRLHRQAVGGLNGNVSYELDFELFTNGGDLEWKPDTPKWMSLKNGAECYSAEIVIRQRYVRSREGSDRHLYTRVERDDKVMKVYKLMIANRTIVSLGSIEQIERIYTQNGR